MGLPALAKSAVRQISVGKLCMKLNPTGDKYFSIGIFLRPALVRQYRVCETTVAQYLPMNFSFTSVVVGFEESDLQSITSLYKHYGHGFKEKQAGLVHQEM